jgi:hypothetical protein
LGVLEVVANFASGVLKVNPLRAIMSDTDSINKSKLTIAVSAGPSIW